MIATLFTLLPFVGTALAHLQMKDPLPIDSPLGATQPTIMDSWSYTAPLKLDGSQWPCHGAPYLSDQSLLSIRATWPAGSSQSFTIAPPGAAHGGGSCQLSLSYDMGKTWNVIHSYIGGCMAEDFDFTQQFELPAEAPNGQALFAWGWFNRLGNREMYHNCAVVEITNGGSGLNSNDYPAPFVANAGVNDCSTIEGTDIVFPNPGKNVVYGGDYAGTTPEAGKGITGSNCGAPGGAGSGSGNSNGGSSGGSSASSASSGAYPTASATDAAGSASSYPASPAPTASSSGTAGSGTGAGVDVSLSLGGHVLAPTAAPSDSTGSGSGSSPGQRVCKRRRSLNVNRVKRSPSPVPANETAAREAHEMRRLNRSRHFARAAGHAARRYHQRS